MANAFNLTAQLQLQAPTNTAQVANQISQQLSGVTVDVKIKANPRQMAAANAQMQGLSKSTQQSANNMGNLNRSLSEAARRFSVITIATGSMLALARSIKNAFGEAIEFERELIKIEQVTGKSVKQLSGLTKEITRLSTSLGASSKDLLGISRILTQAGFEIKKVGAALDILAKTTLGATFEDIEDTTEGAVAVLRQFGEEARKTGGDIKFLQQTMDAINSVSKKFAVESGDLITVIRRTGGVFEAAGGKVNELIALFTSVRATTRETAETISTGLRTIFTRLQRTDTIDQLKDLGIQLRNSEGQFVGAYEAVRRLSVGLSALDPKDFRFSEIVESLGGFRQIGKVLPLIKQFTVAQDALRVAQNSGGSVAKDAATAQQSLAVQFEKTKEKFEALVRGLADSSSFQTMARGVLKLADAFIKMVDALEPLLPMLLPLLGLKLGKALAPGLGALSGASRFAQGRNQGGPIRKFANGGMVPGVGNGDTVEARLEPGEFVIKKDSTKKIGPENLQKLNAGGKIKSVAANDFKTAFNRKRVIRSNKKREGRVDDQSVFMNQKDNFSSRVEEEYLPSKIPNGYARAGKQISSTMFEKFAAKKFGGTPAGGSAPMDLPDSDGMPSEVKRTQGNVSSRSLIEKLIRGMATQNISNQGAQSQLTKGQDNLRLRPMRVIYSDQNKSLHPKQADMLGLKKYKSQAKKKPQQAALGGFIQKFAGGGAVQDILNTGGNIGAAILDARKTKKEVPLKKFGVSQDEVLGTIMGDDRRYNKYQPRAETGVPRYFKQKGLKNKNFSLTTSFLDEASRKVFKDAIVSSSVDGLEKASKTVSQRFLGKSVSIDETAKDNMRVMFNKGTGATVVGQGFENIIKTVANSGAFVESNEQQPFDFPNGISGKIGSLFSPKLPSSFVDTRKSASSKDRTDFKKKATSQIAEDYIASIFSKKSVFAGDKKRFANGGENREDTVPALLTPGEFVFNKDAASRIGPEKLNQMNKQGVVGFNKGGAVGRVQRFAGGGGVGSGPRMGFSDGGRAPTMEEYQAFAAQQGLSGVTNTSMGGRGSSGTQEFNTAANNVQNALDALGLKLTDLTNDQIDGFEAAISSGASEIDVLAAAATAASEAQLAKDTASANLGAQGSPDQIEARTSQTEDSKTDAALRKKLADKQKQVIAQMEARIKLDNAGITDEQALRRAQNVIRAQYGGLATEIQEGIDAQAALVQSQEALAQANEEAAEARQVRQSGLEEVAGVTEGVQKVAQSAQQFVFMGAAAAGLAAQFTGLGNATKTAITQTVGYATALIGGVGTVVDMVASMVQSIITRRLEKMAVEANTVAHAKQAGIIQAGNTQQSLTNKGFGKLAGALGIAAVAFTLASSAAKFFSSKLRAEADEMGKVSEAFIARLEDGQDVGAGLANQELKRIDKESSAQAIEKGSSNTNIAAAGTVVVAALWALGVGLGIITAPITGTAIALFALGAAVVAAVAFFTGWSSSSAAAAEANARQRDEVIASTQAFADLTVSQSNYRKTLSQIDATEGLTDKQKLDRRTEAFDAADVTSRSSVNNTLDSEMRLERLARQKNKSVSELSEDDFKNDPSGARIFDYNTKYLSKIDTAMKEQAADTTQNLGLARDMAIGSGITSFDDAMKNKDYRNAYNDKERNTRELFDRDRRRNSSIIDSNKVVMRSGTLSSDEYASKVQENRVLQEQNEQSVENENKAIADFKLGQENLYTEVGKAAEAQKAAALAAQAAAEKLDKINDFSIQLDVIDQEIQRKNRRSSDIASLNSGRVQDFSFESLPGLKDLTRTGDRGKFSSNLSGIKNSLPKEMQDQAQTMIDSVETGADLLQDGQDKIRAANNGKGIDYTKSDEIGEGKLDETLAALGLTDKVKKGSSEYDQMLASLVTAVGKDGLISDKDFKLIFKPLLDEAQVAGKALDRTNTLRNKALEADAKHIDALNAVRDKEIEARETSLKINQKASDFRRKARGQDQTIASKRSNSLALSSNRLGGIGGQFAGRAKAGNLGSIANTRRQAMQELRESKTRMDLLKPDDEARKKEQAAQLELQRTIKITTEELGHFASATEEVINAQLERVAQEKANRETQQGIIEQAVVGGGEERRQLARTMFNVQKAFATGTLQNQSPEDRSATVALLDKFENVFLPGAGMTGGDLKELLIRSDARRMGLSEEAAMAIFDKTPVEEKLIQSIDHLANVMDNVAAAQSQTLFAAGGPVYKNEGGTIFQPKGTDTVPAMLTPGEFVVRKSAVDKVGVGALHAINQGKPLYRMGGGSVPGASSGYNRQYDEDHTAMNRGAYTAAAAAPVKESSSNNSSSNNSSGGSGLKWSTTKIGLNFNRMLDPDYMKDPKPLPMNAGYFDDAEKERSATQAKTINKIKDLTSEIGDRRTLLNFHKDLNTPESSSNMQDHSQAIAKLEQDLKREQNYLAHLKYEEEKIKAKQARQQETDSLMESSDIKQQAEIRNMTVEGYARQLQIRNERVNASKQVMGDDFGLLDVGASDSDLRLDKLEEEATSALYKDLYKDNLSSVKFFGKGISETDLLGAVYKGMTNESARVYGLALDRAITIAKDKYEASVRDKVNYNDSVKGTSRSAYDMAGEANKFSELDFQRQYSLANQEMWNLIENRKNSKKGVKAPYDKGQEVDLATAGSGNTLMGPDDIPKLPDPIFGEPKPNLGWKGRPMRELVPGTFHETGGRDNSGGGLPEDMTSKPAAKIPSIKGFTQNDAENKKYVEFERLNFDSSMPDYVKDYEKYAYGFIRTYPTDEELRTSHDNLPNQGVIDQQKTISWSDYERYKLRIERVNQKAQERADEASAIARDAYDASRDGGVDKRGTSIRKGILAAVEAGYSEKEIMANSQFKVDQAGAKEKEKALMDDGSFEFGTEFDGRNNEKSRLNNKFGKGKFESSAGGLNNDVLRAKGLTPFQQLRIEAIKAEKGSQSPFRYGPPKDGETPEERRTRQANNANIKRRVDRLRDDQKKKEIRKTTAAATDPNSMASGPGGGSGGSGSGGFGGSGSGGVVGNMLVGLGKMLGGGGAAPAPAAAPAAPAGDDLGVIDEEFLPQIDRDNLSFKQKKRYSGKQIDFINNKNRAMFDLYNQGWAAKDEKEKKKALYAVDSGYRQAAGTRSENWYLGVANQQIMAFGKQLEQQQASTRQARGFAEGGMNGGMDTIPAMLTPGEFVMSREAVAKHGVGYMKNLNMGKATGFRRGGVVGTGNVQYKAGGGSVDGGGGMMIDPSLLSGALDTFVQGFSEQISKLVGPMSAIADKLQGIAESFGSLTMFHTFAGELSMNVNISNKDAIIAAVSDGLLPMISDQIQRQIDASANSFNAGG